MSVYLGLLLIIVGIALLFFEMHSPGFFLAIPATTLIILGTVISLIEDLSMALVLAAVLIIPVTVLTLLIYKRISPETPPVPLSRDSIVGKQGVVIREVVPDSISGKVKIKNTIWSATADEPVSEGVRIRVIDCEGVHVKIAPIEEERS